MQSIKNFQVQFSYLVEDLDLKLSADVELHHSVPHYVVKNIKQVNSTSNTPLLPDIAIKAIASDNGLKWVHINSEVETELSTLIGCQIERTSSMELS